MPSALLRILTAVVLLGLPGTDPLQAQAAKPDTTVVPRPSWAVYMGGGWGGGFQFIAGGQVLLRTPVRALAIVPELALGHGTSALVGAGAHLMAGPGAVRPYVALSVGYLWLGEPLGAIDGSGIVGTPKAGILFDTAAPRGLFGDKSLGWMIEYQGVSFFKTHRVVAGVRWGI